MNETGASTAVASSAEQAAFLVKRLEGYHNLAFDAAFKAAASIVVAIGWIITSAQARSFLAANRSARIGATLALLIIAVVIVTLAVRVYRTSQYAARLLSQLKFLPEQQYRDLTIGRTPAILFVLVELLLLGVLSLFILTVNGVPEP